MTVKFHLPGLRHNYPLNMLLVSLLEQYPENFREGVEIASFFESFRSHFGTEEDIAEETSAILHLSTE